MGRQLTADMRGRHPILRQRKIRVDYDTEYGIEQRTGWSVAINGSYIVQFERFLIFAIAKAIWRHRKQEWEAPDG